MSLLSVPLLSVPLLMVMYIEANLLSGSQGCHKNTYVHADKFGKNIVECCAICQVSPDRILHYTA